MTLERARFEADRAHRQYDAVDPENRLVAAELEARWNKALSQVSEAEARLRAEEHSLAPLDEHQRQRHYLPWVLTCKRSGMIQQHRQS